MNPKKIARTAYRRGWLVAAGAAFDRTTADFDAEFSALVAELGLEGQALYAARGMFDWGASDYAVYASR